MQARFLPSAKELVRIGEVEEPELKQCIVWRFGPELRRETIAS